MNRSDRGVALNCLVRMFNSREEIEGPDGMAVMIDIHIWHEASDALDLLVDEFDDGK